MLQLILFVLWNNWITIRQTDT